MSRITNEQPFFYNGFTETSFFNVVKEIAENMYHESYSAFLSEKQHYDIRLQFYYKDDFTVNGAACHFKNIDRIIINVGTLGKIYTLFYTLLNNPIVFPNIGMKIKNETVLTKWGYDRDKKQLLFEDVPDDVIRRNIAECLAIRAMTFIIAHEIGHHLNGHIFHMKEKNNEFELFMFKNNLEAINLLDYKTIEMDADAFAITNYTNGILKLYETFYSMSMEKHYGIKERELMLELEVFAIHCLFLLLSDCTGENENYLETRYLPIMIRHMLNVDVMLNVVDKYLQTNRNELGTNFYELFRERARKALNHAEVSYNHTFGTKHNFLVDIKKNMGAVEHAQLVLDNWSNVSPELERYARLRLFNNEKIGSNRV